MLIWFHRFFLRPLLAADSDWGHFMKGLWSSSLLRQHDRVGSPAMSQLEESSTRTYISYDSLASYYYLINLPKSDRYPIAYLRVSSHALLYSVWMCLCLDETNKNYQISRGRSLV